MKGPFMLLPSVKMPDLRMCGQSLKQFRHATGQVAAGELRDVRIFGCKPALQVLLPALVDIGRDLSLVFPVKHYTGLCLVKDHRHGAVLLADSQHRPV